MDPSPLHFVSHTHYYCGGDIVVDSSAAIAPGVVLRAAVNASIRIGPGVCVGAGVVIQAKQGCVFVEAGASLGTGVLIVGQGHVGKDACVGPSSTLINPAIAASEVVPPCSLLGTAAASGTAVPQNGTYGAPQSPSFQTAAPFQPSNGPVPSMAVPPRTSPTVQPQAVSPKAVDVPEIDRSPSPNNSAMAAPGHVYGRDHVNSLLSALFPHRQSLNNGSSNPSSDGEL
ncbi:MAG: hypothetical protein AAGI45_13165 [Cyanobacteria bacterium P01_H01_bin.26]